MSGSIKRQLFDMLLGMPEFLCVPCKKLLKKRYPPEYLENLELERFARRMARNFDLIWSRAAQNKKCMIIEKGMYGYIYFNVCYINNMISLMIYSLYKGCIPVIRINEDNPQGNKWGWYFVQPHQIMDTDIEGFEEIPCDIPEAWVRPNMKIVFDRKGWQYDLYRMLYQRLIRLNEETNTYVETEIEAIGDPGEMLGAVLRGTDYITLRPAGHPVQPPPEEVANKVSKLFATGAYKAVYVATEEKKLYDLMARAVGSENVRQNKREYYDELFYGNNAEEIGRVHFDRENDNYWKGLEYLSSLTILSRCRSIVAGNCGATMFATLKGEYEDPIIFDLGLY